MDADPAGPPRDAAAPRRDRTAEAVAARRAEIERALAELVTPALVAEHRRQPIGTHSPALAWVLAYLRQAPTAGKLVVHARRPAPGDAGRAGDSGPGPYSLVKLSGQPGGPHEQLAGRFATEEEALHAVFLRRLSDYGLDRGGATGAGTDA